QEIADTIVQRQDSSAPDQNIGVIHLDAKQPAAPILPQNPQTNTSFPNNYAAANSAVISNILYTSAYMINANDTKGNNSKTSIELRLYSDSKTANTNLQNQANNVMNILLGHLDGPQLSFTINEPTKNPSLPEGSVKIVVVNIDDDKDRRSPSQQAVDG